MSTASGRPRPRKTDLILLVDRCLAPEVAYEISKMDGLYGIPLHEHYGDGAAQRLDDITFLAEAGQRGWGILTQNPRMWQVPQERTCIVDNHTRVFSLDDPNASKTLKGLVLGRHLLSVLTGDCAYKP
jgi:PIN like domain